VVGHIDEIPGGGGGPDVIVGDGGAEGGVEVAALVAESTKAGAEKGWRGS
jgi:hypothetical protein